MDRARRRSGLPGRQGAGLPARRGRRGDGRDLAATSRSSSSPTAAAGCSLPPGWSTGRCRPTTSPRSRHVRNPLYGQQRNPTRQRFHAPRESLRPGRPASRERGVPVRADHLPADRAPHGRRHVADACPTWPSCSPSSSARSRRSWPPSAASSTAAGRRSSPRAAPSRRG